MVKPAESPIFSRLEARAFAAVDIAPLVWFRVAFGVLMFVEVWRYVANRWIPTQFVEPRFLFKYPGFEWVKPLPAAGLEIHFLVLAVLSLFIAIGLFYRAAAALFFAGFSYVFLLDEARYLNHFHLICLFSLLLVFMPAHRAFSFDALRRPSLRSGKCPAWALWLLRAQICIVFFFAGIAKINGDWLRAEPMRMWLAKRADMPVIGGCLTQEWAAWAFSYGGLVFDLAIVPLLLWRRTRCWAFVPLAVFNFINGWIFHIGIFPWLAFGATVILFSPRLPHPIRALWTPVVSPMSLPPGRKRIVSSLVAIYLILQITIPLRHWLYPGDVQWTEEGHRFSWRMKLRDKQSEVDIQALDPETGESWAVDLEEYLTYPQYVIASGQPDMILQLCHFIRDDLRKAGFRKIQIRARVMVSLNGRKPQLLVNPAVDLAAERRTLGHASWIMPLAVPFTSRTP